MTRPIVVLGNDLLTNAREAFPQVPADVELCVILLGLNNAAHPSATANRTLAAATMESLQTC